MALILGIDIGTRSVRGAVVRGTLRSIETERYLEVPIHHIDASGPRTSHVTAAVAELVRSLPSAPDSIIVCLDGKRVSLRTVKIPAAAKKRAHEVLPFELESLLPFSLEEAVVDYQEIAEADGQVSLLAAAVPEGVVADMLETLSTQEISPREIAVGAAALEPLITTVAGDATEAIVFVDLADEHTDVCIVRGGATELARTLDFGGNALSTRGPALRNALHQTIMKYRAEGGPLPSQVFLSGEGSQDRELVTWIGSATGLSADVLSLPAAKGASEPPPASFGKAWALAARTSRRGKRLDMRRGKFALPRGMSQLRDYAIFAVACSFAVFGSYVFSAWAEYRALAEERDALAEQLEKITEEHFGKGTRSAKFAKELLEGGGKSNDPLPRFDAFRALAAISAAMPEDVTHDTRKLEVQLDEIGQTGKLEIQGTLPDLNARDQLVAALDANECINDLAPGKISSVPGEDKKNYTLEAIIACPGAIPEKSSSAKRAKRSK
jgi:hypothetical protein